MVTQDVAMTAVVMQDVVMREWAWPNPFDGAVLDWVLSVRSPGLTGFVRAVTTVGNTLPMLGIAIAGVVVLLSLRQRGWALYCGLTSLAGYLVMAATKDLFGRERPPIPPRLLVIESQSFPSGHALNSMVIFTTFAVAACALSGRRWPFAAAFAGSAAIGLSRVYLAAHWMTDVLAGWAIGLIVVALGLAVRSLVLRSRVARRVTPARAGPPDRPAGPPGAAG